MKIMKGYGPTMSKKNWLRVTRLGTISSLQAKGMYGIRAVCRVLLTHKNLICKNIMFPCNISLWSLSEILVV